MLPFQNVSFSYSGNEEGMLYKNLEFGIDCDSRIALVGPNGAGGYSCHPVVVVYLSRGGNTHHCSLWLNLLHWAPRERAVCRAATTSVTVCNVIISQVSGVPRL